MHTGAAKGRRHNIRERGLNIISIQHRIFGGLFKTIRTVAHHIGQGAAIHAHLAMKGAHAAKAGVIGMLDQIKAVLGFNHIRHRGMIFESVRKNRWARAWTAAAMRRAKCLMEINMHRIDTKIARAHTANKGVKIRPVTIKITACFMDKLGDFDDVIFEQSARIGIGQHDTRNVTIFAKTIKFVSKHIHIDAAFIIGGDFIAGETTLYSGGRIGAMSTFRDKDAAFMAHPIGVKPSANCHHPAKLAMRARFGGQSNSWHIAKHHQPMGEFMH